MLLGLVVLLFFGPKRLPEMGRSLGRGLREFKSSVTNDKEQELDLELAQSHEPEPVDLGHLEREHTEKERAA
ncbi:MAG: twin-arginine translocase TatA/TatE family subunit [Actinomycetota bacterium]|nr:twin-arginine translocase TatA/TatE family subunit [Actinomycetota bacterium]